MSHPIGCWIAIGGGLIAQAPEAHVGWAGLVVGLAGLGFQFIRGYLDYRLAMRRLDGFEARASELERRLMATSAELAEARKNAHDRADHTNAVVSQIATQVVANTDCIQGLIPATRGVERPIA